MQPLDELKKSIPGFEDKNKFCLTLQKRIDQTSCNWNEPHEILIPSALICSTHKKVRLSSDYAVSTCEIIVENFKNDVVPRLIESIKADPDEFSDEEYNHLLDLSKNISFDVVLREISDIKSEILKSNNYFSENNDSFAEFELKKRSFLTKSYARCHWVAQFNYQEEKLFKILFDATEIPQGNAVVGIYPDSDNGYSILITFLAHIKSAESKGLMLENSDKFFFDSFIKELKYNNLEERSIYLDTKFGELRAPLYIKDAQELSFDKIRDNSSKIIMHEPQKKSLSQLFEDHLLPDNKLIWAIGHDGSLIVGKEFEGQGGHPCITRFKPARIAGELKYSNGKWLINAKSGRYSGDYSNGDCLLDNAIELFKDLFYRGYEEFAKDPEFKQKGND